MLHPEVAAADARGAHSVEGRVVIVTGSGQGVGRGMANHLAKNGATVVVADYQPDALARAGDDDDPPVDAVHRAGVVDGDLGVQHGP